MIAPPHATPRSRSPEPARDPGRDRPRSRPSALLTWLPIVVLLAGVVALERVVGPIREFEHPWVLALLNFFVLLSVASALVVWLVRRRAEGALEAAATKYSTMFDTTSDGIWVHDRQGQILEVNDAYCRMSGYSRDELAGMAISHLEAGESPEEVAAHVRTVMDSGHDRFESRHRRKDGSIIDVDVTALYLDIDGGRIAIFVRDITERKAAEARLRYVASFPTNNPYPVVEADFEGHVRYANPAALRLFPELAAQKTAHPWLGDWQATTQHLLDEMPRGQTYARTVVVGERAYDQTMVVVGERDVIRIYGLDITERTLAERALRESEVRREAAQATEAERRRLYHVLETLPAMICLMTADYHVAFANRAFRDRFGEARGRPCYQYRYGFAGPCQFCEAYKVLTTGQPQHWEAVAPDGTVMDVYDVPFTDVDGSPMILEMDLDITTRRRTERELQAASENLAERAAQLRALASELTLSEQRERKRLATLLHDHLQQLLIGAKFRAAILGRSRDEATRQAAVEIGHLLDASISASRSLTSELSPPILHQGELPACLEWLARWMFERHGLIATLAIEQGLPRLAEDVKILLFESVRELLFNAVKHANVRAASVSVGQVAGAEIRITVSDEGPGFEPGALKKAGETGGGFGLFSVRERLEVLGGRMDIDSGAGRGSRFTLTAPLSRTAVVAAPPAVSVPPRLTSSQETTRVGSSTPGVPIRVLLADDHEVVREGLRHLLGEEPDIEIAGEAANGLEAVEFAAELHPDVILMDVSMPKLDGVDATRAIHAAHPDIQIVGLSMFEDHERAEDMRRAGATDYLTKSAPAGDLIAAIRRAGLAAGAGRPPSADEAPLGSASEG